MCLAILSRMLLSSSFKACVPMTLVPTFLFQFVRVIAGTMGCISVIITSVLKLSVVSYLQHKYPVSLVAVWLY
jgi:hypothetical protein